jgi:hypothetical protein
MGLASLGLHIDILCDVLYSVLQLTAISGLDFSGLALSSSRRVPDPYFLSAGVSSSPIGYTDGYGRVTEVWEHLNIGRMYGYDGTFYKSTTQGWMGQKCPAGPMEGALLAPGEPCH